MTRTTKQIVYGVGYAALWFVLIYSGYALTLKPPPSCTDKVMSRDETAVDCGGAYCESCEIRELRPISFGAVQLLASVDGRATTALVEIRNSNVTYGTPKLPYAVLLYGANDEILYRETGEVPVYPAEVKYRLVVNVPVEPALIVRAVATTTAPVSWQKITEFARPKTPLRGIKVEYDEAGSRAIISGVVKNDNPLTIRRVTLSALLSDKKGALVGVSKTFAQDLVSAEERFFKIDVPLPETVEADDLAEPKVNVDAER